MARPAKPLADVLFTTRYHYSHTVITDANMHDKECWICVRPYYSTDPGEVAKPVCIPVKLSCGHVVGKHCFDEYRKLSDDVELCPQCRQKIDPPAIQGLLGGALAWICQTRWFKWHDRKTQWTFWGVERRPALDSEIKMYDGEVLNKVDIATIIFLGEGYWAYLYVVLPVYCVTIPLVVLYTLYGILGHDRAVLAWIEGFDFPFGFYSWNLWVRLPEVMLLADLWMESLHHSEAIRYPYPVLWPVMVISFFMFIRMTWGLHFRKRSRTMLGFLVLGRLTYALIGHLAIVFLSFANTFAYTLVAGMVITHANEQVRRRVKND